MIYASKHFFKEYAYDQVWLKVWMRKTRISPHFHVKTHDYNKPSVELMLGVFKKLDYYGRGEYLFFKRKYLEKIIKVLLKLWTKEFLYFLFFCKWKPCIYVPLKIEVLKFN